MMSKYQREINLLIGKQKKPVLRLYDLGLIIFNFYKEVHTETPSSDIFYNHLNSALESGVLNRSEFDYDTYHVLGKYQHNPYEIICAIDDFCCLSHLSSMKHNGLTPRMPYTIYITCPSNWDEVAKEKMKDDLGADYQQYIKCGLPKLVQAIIRKIGVYKIKYQISSDMEDKHISKPSNVVTRSFGIVGTMENMLKEPWLCGGELHVAEIFEEMLDESHPKYCFAIEIKDDIEHFNLKYKISGTEWLKN